MFSLLIKAAIKIAKIDTHDAATQSTVSDIIDAILNHIH